MLRWNFLYRKSLYKHVFHFPMHCMGMTINETCPVVTMWHWARSSHHSFIGTTTTTSWSLDGNGDHDIKPDISCNTDLREMVQSKSFPTISILTVDRPQLWQRWSCTPLFISLSLSLSLCLCIFPSPHLLFIPALLVVLFLRHVLHASRNPLKPLMCCCTLSLLYPPRSHAVRFIALGGLETCGSRFISVMLFGFLFLSVHVICITLFCFSVIVLRKAMVPDCLAYWIL